MDVGRSECMAVICGWEVTVYMPEEAVWTSGHLFECPSGYRLGVHRDTCFNIRLNDCLERCLDVGRNVVWIPERLPECQSEGLSECQSECMETWRKYNLYVCKYVWNLVGISVYMSECVVW